MEVPGGKEGRTAVRPYAVPPTRRGSIPFQRGLCSVPVGRRAEPRVDTSQDPSPQPLCWNQKGPGS